MAQVIPIETLIKEMADLTEAVKGGGVVDHDKLAGLFVEKYQAMVQAQQEQIPVRRGSKGIGYNAGMINKSNRYHSLVKNIGLDGHARIGKNEVKAIDLWLATKLLDAAAAKNNKVKPASDELREALKALDTTTAGAGAELVPLDLMDSLWEDMFLASRIVGLFDTLPMTSGTMEIPLGLGAITWRKGTQNTPTTASNPGTDKVDFKVTEEVAEVNWSYSLDEDAVVAMMPIVRARFAQSGAEAMDAFMLNADATNAATGNINLDDADPADTSYYLSDGQDGIRHQWLVDNAAMGINAGGDALTDTDITNALAVMDKYGVDPSRLAFITDTKTYYKGFLATGAGSPGEYMITLDKMGSQAIVLTGQVGAYRGIPIVLSESAPRTEADGKVSTTTANNTLGQINIVNRDMWYVGWQRDLLLEIDRDIQKRQHIMVGSFRQAVAAHGDRTTNKHTAGIRNIL